MLNTFQQLFIAPVIKSQLLNMVYRVFHSVSLPGFPKLSRAALSSMPPSCQAEPTMPSLPSSPCPAHLVTAMHRNRSFLFQVPAARALLIIWLVTSRDPPRERTGSGPVLGGCFWVQRSPRLSSRVAGVLGTWSPQSGWSQAAFPPAPTPPVKPGLSSVPLA